MNPGEKLKVMLVNESQAETSAGLEDRLRADGYPIIGTFTPDDDLIGALNALEPDVLFIHADDPAPEFLSKLEEISGLEYCPIVFSSTSDDAGLIRSAVQAGANAIAAGTARKVEVRTLIDVAFARFQEKAALRHERDVAIAALAERKLVERAKGIIMKERNLSEDETHRLLQKMAMDRGEPLADLAARIIEASELLK